MSDIEILIQVAKLDGWEEIQQNPMYPNDDYKMAGYKGEDRTALLAIPNYVKSRDAIIPLIDKHHWNNVRELRRFHQDIIYQILGIDENTPIELNIQAMITAIPRQLCVAILKLHQ